MAQILQRKTDVMYSEECRSCFAELRQAEHDLKVAEEAALSGLPHMCRERLKSQIAVLKDRIAKGNIRLIGAIAKIFSSHWDKDALFSAGGEALFWAIEGYDLDRGFEFTSYACEAIRRSMLNVVTRQAKWVAQCFNYAEANRCEWTDEDASYDSDALQKLQEVLQHLSQIERNILTLRFGLGNAESLSRREIGEFCSLTKSQVRKIENRALKKLRRQFWLELLQ